jgi:6-pyruvoyltetrahydropterin/6-carboxytetrahydropterin synthase
MRITKQYRTETGHRLSNYDGRCAHFHGHSYLWEVTVQSSELDYRQMVADFKDLKRIMDEVLDPLDHAMIIHAEDPLLIKLGAAKLRELLTATNGAAPRLFYWHENPTAESFAAWAAREVQQRLPQGIAVARVIVWETATSFAEWEA